MTRQLRSTDNYVEHLAQRLDAAKEVLAEVGKGKGYPTGSNATVQLQYHKDYSGRSEEVPSGSKFLFATIRRPFSRWTLVKVFVVPYKVFTVDSTSSVEYALSYTAIARWELEITSCTSRKAKLYLQATDDATTLADSVPKLKELIDTYETLCRVGTMLSVRKPRKKAVKAPITGNRVLRF